MYFQDRYKSLPEIEIVPSPVRPKLAESNDRLDIKDWGESMSNWLVKKTNEGYNYLGLSYNQVQKEDPFTFFVMSPYISWPDDERIIINPTIKALKTSKWPNGVHSEDIRDTETIYERCPHKHEDGYGRERLNTIYAKFLTLGDKGFISREAKLTKGSAYIFQHMIDHLNGKYIL